MSKFKLKENYVLTTLCILSLGLQFYLAIRLGTHNDIPFEIFLMIAINIFGIYAANSAKPILVKIFISLAILASIVSLTLTIPGYSYPSDSSILANQKGGEIKLPKLPGGNTIWILGGAYLYFTKK